MPDPYAQYGGQVAAQADPYSQYGGNLASATPQKPTVFNIPPDHIAMTDTQGQLQHVPKSQAADKLKQGWVPGQNVPSDEPSLGTVALNVAKNLPGEIGRTLLNLAFYKPAQGQTPANSGPEIQLAQQSLAAAQQAGQFGKQAVTAIRNKDYSLAAASGGKALVSGLAAADPFASGPVAQINELQSQGKPKEAAVRGLTNAAMLAPGVTPVRTAIGKVAGTAGDVANELVAQDRTIPAPVQMSPTATKMTQVFPTLPESIAANVAPKIEATIDPAKGIGSHSDLVAATEQAKKNVIQGYRDKAPGGLIENLSANDRSSMGQDIFELEVAQRHFEGTASKAQRYAENVATNPATQAAKGLVKIGGRGAIGYAIGGPVGAVIAQTVGATKYGGIGDLAGAGSNVIGRLGEPITPDILDAQVADIFGGPQPSSSVSPLSPTSARVPSVGGVVPTVNEQEIVSALRNQGYAGEDARAIARQAITDNPHDFDAALRAALRLNRPEPVAPGPVDEQATRQAFLDKISQLRGQDMGGLGEPFGPTGRNNPVANIRVTPGRFSSPITGLPSVSDGTVAPKPNFVYSAPTGEGAAMEQLVSEPIDRLKNIAQARGVVFDGSLPDDDLRPQLINSIVQDMVDKRDPNLAEFEAQTIERSRFSSRPKRGGFTGGFQPPLPGAGPSGGPTPGGGAAAPDIFETLKKSLAQRGVTIPGETRIDPTSTSGARLSILKNELASATDPAERASIQAEIDRETTIASGQKPAPLTDQAVSENLPASQPRSVNPADEYPKPEFPQSPNTYMVPTKDITIAPNKLQFRTDVNPVTGEQLGRKIENVPFDPELAGPIKLWKDPQSGTIYLADGHHRLALANRSGVDNIEARFFDVPTATAARARAALGNIAEGNATLFDAAKFFRESGITPEQLAQKNITLSSGIAQKALSLSRLNDFLFEKVRSQQLSENQGAIIGDASSDPAVQESIWKEIQSRESRGRSVTDANVAELAKLSKLAGTTTQTEMTLFGAEEHTTGLLGEFADVMSQVRKDIIQRKNIFGAVAKESRAKTLGAVEGQTIVPGENAKISQESAQLAEIFDKVATSPGPVNDMLKNAAVKMTDMDAPRARRFREATSEAVIDELRKIVPGNSTPLTGGIGNSNATKF